MPELPEVETLRFRLDQVLAGRLITDIKITSSKSFFGDSQFLTGKRISKVIRRAKVLAFEFEGTEGILATHLKMTGQLIFLDTNTRIGGGHPTADWITSLPSKHTRITYFFQNGSRLFFNDQRKFGWMKIFDLKSWRAMVAKYGPDIIDSGLNAEYLQNKFSRTGRKIKQVIMDNSIVAGVGNIYACDGLNLAQISPLTPANKLSEAQINKLLFSLRQVIELGIKMSGTTFDGKYVNIDGLAGGYQDYLLAYGREGEKCKNCEGEIIKIKVGGRGTYYCQECQV